MSLSRRGLLQVGAALGGGLVARIYLPEAHAAAAPRVFAPNAWLRLDAERVVFYCAQAEMGQGVTTSLPTILCEELDFDPRKLEVKFAPAARIYDNPMMRVQATGGSTSVKVSWSPLREAGARARELLRMAAAQRWRVPLSEIEAADGQLRHRGGQVASYQQMARFAGTTRIAAPRLKRPEQYKYIGKPMDRLDLPPKVFGSPIFGMDVTLSGMRVAVVVRCPVFGGKVRSVDDAQAKAMPGVDEVVSLGYGVGVVAQTYWHARQAAEKLVIAWDEGPLSNLSSAEVQSRFEKAIAAGGGKVARSVGDAEAAVASAAKQVQATYSAPYLAHAPMEPMCCTARVTPEKCELWVPTQSAGLAAQTVVQLTGLSHEQIEVHSTFLGGGFGRRGMPDFIVDAVTLSKAVNKPVKVVWSREDDIRQGYYRPASHHTLWAGLDEEGRVLGLVHKVATPSILRQIAHGAVPVAMPNGMPEALKSLAGSVGGAVIKKLVDPMAVEGAASTDYALPAHRVEWYAEDPGVPLAFWRSVGHSYNAFVMEGFIDELAHAAGKDPLAFRRDLLKYEHRNRWVLELAAERAGWYQPLGEGVFRGIAAHHSYDSYAAAVAEVRVEPAGIRVLRVVVAIDCGQVVNPDLVAAQLEGSVIFGLSAALKGNITLEKGGVVQSNFHDYPILRMNEAPKIETHFAVSQAAPTGVGEPAVPLMAPAVANAVFAATGKRLRSLPLSLEG